jgi:hypothetical protein
MRLSNLFVGGTMVAFAMLVRGVAVRLRRVLVLLSSLFVSFLRDRFLHVGVFRQKTGCRMTSTPGRAIPLPAYLFGERLDEAASSFRRISASDLNSPSGYFSK